MSNTLTIRLPEELLERLREKSRITGLPAGRLVRLSLEATLSDEKDENKSAREHTTKNCRTMKYRASAGR